MTRPNAELLRSLGKLARGLSALFWGLPAALLICVETAKADWLKPLGIIPALVATGLLLFGLWQMSAFQKQERPWLNALDRAKILGLVNLGLCPFLYWHNKMPQESFFGAVVFVLVLSALFFLFNLNVLLKQLGAMLPDETLRQEIRQFTAINRWLLVILFLFAAVFLGLLHARHLPLAFNFILAWVERGSFWFLVLFVLLPLAMTMALIWKTKETILDSIFSGRP